MDLTVRVFAKINLVLCVDPISADGYHQLGTVFQTVDLFDDLHLSPATAGEVNLQVSGEGAKWVPTDESNLVVKAANLLLSEFGPQPVGVSIRLHKQIPVTAGMAGGSADGAGTLLGCAKLWGLELSQPDLLDLAARLGSDVPFTLLGNTAIGTGRGEKLTPIPTCGTFHWVLAFAHGGLSTPKVFNQFDRLESFIGTEIPSELLTGLTNHDLDQVGKYLRNDLQPAAFGLREELKTTIAAGIQAGALGGIVCGSGPTCLFLVKDQMQAKLVASKLAELPTVRATACVTGPKGGVTIL